MLLQLMGMWYGIEVINHNEDRHYVRTESSCPIIHVSQEKSHRMPFRPLHLNYDYRYNYGERPNVDRNNQNNQQQYDQNSYRQNPPTRFGAQYDQQTRFSGNQYEQANRLSGKPYEQNPYRQRSQYEQKQYERNQYEQNQYRQNQFGTGPYDQRYGTTNRDWYPLDMGRLRIFWDENGRNTEYQLRYNVSEPGFWFSSGPRNGTSVLLIL